MHAYTIIQLYSYQVPTIHSYNTHLNVAQILLKYWFLKTANIDKESQK